MFCIRLKELWKKSIVRQIPYLKFVVDNGFYDQKLILGKINHYILKKNNE